MINRRKSDRRFMSEINVVPLVDVVLVLLVIFMITAPLMLRGMDVDLPQSATNTVTPEDRVVLSVSGDKKIFIDDTSITLQGLGARLTDLKDRSPDVSVFLKADRNVSYGLVVRVMDIVKTSGIEKLGMVTEPIPNSENGKS